MIIDIHTHVFSDEIAAKVIKKLKYASHTQPFSDGTSTGLQKACKKTGVNYCVTLPIATDQKQVRHMNDRIISANLPYPETGLIPFGAMHPDYPDWKQEL